MKEEISDIYFAACNLQASLQRFHDQLTILEAEIIGYKILAENIAQRIKTYKDEIEEDGKIPTSITY